MCGIAGLLGVPDQKRRVMDMLDVEAHRGPDGQGIWRTPITEGRELTLGHRRLSILDLSEAGAQPMADSTGRFVLTYNGEIYDYVEVRAELAALGGVLRSHTESEGVSYTHLDV